MAAGESRSHSVTCGRAPEKKTDAYGYPICFSRTTEIYYDLYLTSVHVVRDPKAGVEEISDELCARLGLVKRDKEPVHGRRAMDLVGLYEKAANGAEREVEVVGFYRGTGANAEMTEAIAFSKTGRGLAQVRAWSEGTVEQFLLANKHLGLRTLFPE